MKPVLRRPGDEVGVLQDAQVHRDGRLDALDDGHLERAPHARDRLGAGRGRAS